MANFGYLIASIGSQAQGGWRERQEHFRDRAQKQVEILRRTSSERLVLYRTILLGKSNEKRG